MRQVCLAVPTYPSSLGTLTRLPAYGAVFWGMGRETLYFTEAVELSMWMEGHAALGTSGSCWDAGIGREGAEDKLVGPNLPAGEPTGVYPFFLTLPQG